MEVQLTKEQYEEVVKCVVQAVLKKQDNSENVKLVEKTALVKNATIPVEVSARHVHLSVADAESIFGKGYKLIKKRELSQTGEFLSEERVTIVGKKGVLENVAVLGPMRKATQIEVTMSDCRKLGVDAVVRDSGDIHGTPGVTIVGAYGAVTLQQGVVVARRHIHMTQNDALFHKVSDGELVQVSVQGTRPLIFGDVLVRVSDKFVLAMHIDTEEANVCGLGKNVNACIVKRLSESVTAPQAVSKEVCDQTAVFSGKLLTEQKLSVYRQKKQNKVQISKKTIITALACDYAQKYNITFVRV